MKSKLSKSYPAAGQEEWLVFLNPCQTGIDPIFASRLAALAQYIGKKINIISGYRSHEEQVKAYKNSGGYQDPKGNWYGGSGYAARPGNSPHEYRIAIDTSDKWLKALEKEAATNKQLTLIKFGIYKPLTKGNGYSILEDWHIEPIETWTRRSVTRYKELIPEVDGNMDVREFQKVMGLVADGIPGPKTQAKAEELKVIISKITGGSKVAIKTGEQAIKWLADNKVIVSQDYWLQKIKEVPYLDALLIKIVNEFSG